MAISGRLESALEAALSVCRVAGAPPLLAKAMRHAVFPAGARVRPRLALAVAAACGDDAPGLADAAAASIELLHCASLVHDDLPCFDDAPTRRGMPSVHRAFGERIAVLAGDALIVQAFGNLARAGSSAPGRVLTLLDVFARATGMPFGIAAGQSWECEPAVSLADYHRAKTGALFAGATMAGASAAGADPGPWAELGECLGEAFQVADDLRDAFGDATDLGKPVGRDAQLGRPNAVRQLGTAGATQRLKYLVDQAIASVPDCRGAAELRVLLEIEAQQFLPAHLAKRAA